MAENRDATKEMLQRIQNVMPAAADHQKVSMIISWILTCYELSLEEVHAVLTSVARHQRLLHDTSDSDNQPKKVH